MTLIQMFSVLAGMESLQRFSMTRLAVPESVLSHTGFVALGCLFISSELNAIRISDEKINVQMLLSSALLHDVEEIFTGDIARPVKYESHLSQKMFGGIKDRAFAKVLNQLGCSVDSRAIFSMNHDGAKDLCTREGIIVALVDLMAVVYKVWDEVSVRHNYSIMRVVNINRWNLPKLRKAIADVFDDTEQCFYMTNMLNEMEHIAESAIAIVEKSSDLGRINP